MRQQQTKHSEDKANLPRQLTVHKATVDSRKASADAAKAQLDTALLNLSYCHIVAPVDGIASQRSAETGGRISQGQQLIVVVQIYNLWTTANFKETQLRKMHVGQHVTIEVDSLDAVSYTHLDVYKRQPYKCRVLIKEARPIRMHRKVRSP